MSREKPLVHSSRFQIAATTLGPLLNQTQTTSTTCAFAEQMKWANPFHGSMGLGKEVLPAIFCSNSVRS